MLRTQSKFSHNTISQNQNLIKKKLLYTEIILQSREYNKIISSPILRIHLPSQAGIMGPFKAAIPRYPDSPHSQTHIIYTPLLNTQSSHNIEHRNNTESSKKLL
jgi:hypothetical protein